MADLTQTLPGIPPAVWQGGRAVPGAIPNVPAQVVPSIPPAVSTALQNIIGPGGNFVPRNAPPGQAGVTQGGAFTPAVVPTPLTVANAPAPTASLPAPVFGTAVQNAQALQSAQAGNPLPSLNTPVSAGAPYSFNTPAPGATVAGFTPQPLQVTSPANPAPVSPTATLPGATALGGDAVPVYRGMQGPGFAGSAAANSAAAIKAGFDMQTQRSEDATRGAENYISQGHGIFEQASRARAITGILGAVSGPNNVGATAGNAADVVNQGLVSQANEATQAGEQRYATQTTAGTAAAQLAQQAQQFAATPREVSSETRYNPVTSLPMGSTTLFALPGGVGAGGLAQAPRMIGSPPAAPPAGFIVGAKATQADGHYSVGDGRVATIQGGVVTGIQ